MINKKEDYCQEIWHRPTKLEDGICPLCIEIEKLNIMPQQDDKPMNLDSAWEDECRIIRRQNELERISVTGA